MKFLLSLILVIFITGCTKKTLEQSKANVLLLTASFTEVEDQDLLIIEEKDGNTFTYTLKELNKKGNEYFFEFTSITKMPLLTLSTKSKDGETIKQEVLNVRL